MMKQWLGGQKWMQHGQHTDPDGSLLQRNKLMRITPAFPISPLIAHRNPSRPSSSSSRPSQPRSQPFPPCCTSWRIGA
eukprot:scaffold6330_cov107-Isochrysis_galbana.AAC.2